MIYPSNIPYMRTVKRKVYLDRGTPTRKGNLVFLLTASFQQSMYIMNSQENCIHNGFVPYYFNPPRYILTLGRKRYKINKTKDEQNLLVKAITKNVPQVKPYPAKILVLSNENRSLFYDLSTQYALFNLKTAKLTLNKRLDIFWKVFRGIFEDSYGLLTNKTVIMDAEHFKLSLRGSIKERIDNPLYLFYMTLLKRPDLVQGLDIDFLMYAGDKILKVNFSRCDKDSYRDYLIQLKKLYIGADVKEATEEELKQADEESDKEEVLEAIGETPEKDRPPVRTNTSPKIANAIVSPRVSKLKDEVNDDPVANATKLLNNLSHAPDTEELIKKIKAYAARQKADKTEDDTAVDASPEENAEIEEEILDIDEDAAEAIDDGIAGDEAALADIYRKLTADTTPKSQRSSARDEQLRKEQEKIKVRNSTIGDLAKINPKQRKIPTTDVSKVTHSMNKNIKQVKFNNFNKAYVEEVMDKDIANVFTDLANKSIKMYILDIDVKDTSTVTDLKETWTVHLEDENRNRHTIKVDIPKFHDKNFMWLGGNEKDIKNQLFFLPLVKVSPDIVMLVSNYNKMQIRRIGGRSLSGTTIIKKMLDKDEELAKYFTKGSAAADNIPYITTLEYDDYANSYNSFRHGGLHIYFSQRNAYEIAAKQNITVPDKKIFIGIYHGNPVFIDANTQKTDGGKSITELIVDTFSDEAKSAFKSNQKKVPKRVTYTAVTTMKQEIPICILLCLWEGLSKVLEKSKIKYRLVEKFDKDHQLGMGESFLQFKDCYLVYEKTIPAELLLSGIRVIETKNFELFEMDTPLPYVPYVEKKYGKLSILNALNNVYEFTIGAIEREVLNDMNLPTDLVELILYANNLLADSQCISELDMSNYRVRSAEIIPAILHDTIAKAYVPFKNSNGKKKLSIPQDAVIKKLLALETTEDTSTLNPFLELETTHGVSTKGWRGVNLSYSYTVPKRGYDDSMRGVVGVSSSPDAQVGINRTLSMEPNINSLRGYIDVETDMDKLKDVNLFAPAELLIPLGSTRDDPIRTGHSVKQSRASLPVKNASPVLMSNGSDESCTKYLSQNFCFVAEQDGKVIDYDERAEIIILEYKDGSHKAINLGKNIVKNGGGGFELSNSLTTDLQVGDRFKANETIAWHKNFFRKIPGQGVRMCVGAMVSVGIYSLYDTYEDGTFITESASDKCEADMVFRIKCVLGKNANVFDMVKVGDKIEVGQPLISFDESFAESDINALLANLGDDEELKEAVLNNNKNAKKSDKSGVIEEIKIYSGSELDELSPSLKKVVSQYYQRIDRKTKILNKYDKDSEGIIKCGVMITEASGKTEPNRYGVIRGEKVYDGVLIEFYLKHSEPLETGSKIANFSPLKNVLGEVIPKGYEPRALGIPGKERILETIISPSSILARMVGSVYMTVGGNKVIVFLKEKLRDIYESSLEFSKKRKKMEKLIYDVFSAMDKTGQNTKKYKAQFQPMSDDQFRRFFKEFFTNEYHYLIYEMVDYEVTLEMDDIEEAADVLGIPLYEYVSFPHLNMDNDNPVVTPHKILTGFIHLKRPQQTVAKKNGMSTGTSRRAGITNQVTGDDKNGRESDLENCMLVSMGLNKTLKELNGPRADDSVAEKEMLQLISTRGYFSTDELTDDVANKATLNAVDTYFLGMGLKTDLVTKGLKLPKNIDAE